MTGNGERDVTTMTHDVNKHWYFEDYEPGMRIAHPRGATMGQVENQYITKLTLNTAQAHFNEHYFDDDYFLGAGVLVNGTLVLAMVVGLTSQFTAEHAVRELGCTDVKITAPTHHGDTLWAYTEVLGKAAMTESGAGRVDFFHWGRNQRGRRVVEVRRSVLVRSRAGGES